jgi:hypothetical protein
LVEELRRRASRRHFRRSSEGKRRQHVSYERVRNLEFIWSWRLF